MIADPDEPVPHRCRRSRRCPGADDTGQGGLIPAETGLCLPCEAHTRAAIAALPADYVDLTRALDRGTSDLAELVTASKDPPAPLWVEAAALAADLVRVATTWAEPVAERIGVDWNSTLMDRTRPGCALQRAARLLAARLPVLLALRDMPIVVWAEDGRYHRLEPVDGITGALTMVDLHHRTRAMLGVTKLTHHLPAPCPRCDYTTLVRDDGDEDVYCQRCGITWAYEDYRRLTLILANDLHHAS